MSYNPAHDGVVAFAPEVGTITESANGVTPAALPPIPDSATLIGYTPNMPELAANLNNSKGKAVGDDEALYDRRGSIRPQFRIDLRPGSAGFLQNYGQRGEDRKLPYFAAFVGISGVFTSVVRFCKVNDWSLSTQSGNDEGGEIQVNLNALGIAIQELETPIETVPGALAALGTPLMYHDFRSLVIPVSSTPTQFRHAVQSFSCSVNHNVAPTNDRPNWGDNQALSRTTYELIEHHIDASAEIVLSSRLPESLISGAVRAQNWGDIPVGISDVGSNFALDLTLKDALVSNKTIRGVASNELMAYTINLALKNVLVAAASGSGSGSG